jgi:hypothetical protein
VSHSTYPHRRSRYGSDLFHQDVLELFCDCSDRPADAAVVFDSSPLNLLASRR